MKFAEIIVPLPLAQSYTYSVPDEMAHALQVGMRVIVHFGARQFYTGIILEIHDRKPDYDKIKPISAILDDKPTLLPSQLQLWQFISSYYQASFGDIYKAALPSALKIETETTVSLIAEMVTEYSDYSTPETAVINILSDGKEHPITDFSTYRLRHVRQLIERGVVANNESTSCAYKPKYETNITLAEGFEQVRELLPRLQKTPKQHKLLETYIHLSASTEHITKKMLLDETGYTDAPLKSLIGKGILAQTQRRIDRIDTTTLPWEAIHPLSDAQQTAYEEIEAQFKVFNTVLLHGVTSSGKTEIYIRLIKKYIEAGKQVLMLVPEIGLTQQLSARMKRFFGSAMGIYHSYCTNYERVETYNRQLSDTPYRLILGVRSSIFLPFKNLGLIIVDEEHDTSYKQNISAPRYQARDAAIYLAGMHGAKALLGTATPSVETYANCHFKKYGLVTLSERYGRIELPAVRIVNMQECYKKRAIKGHFSFELIKAMTAVLHNKHQIILFQNRRGFASYTECTECGYVPRCPNCDVSLTYHKRDNTLTCHYCGYTVPMQPVCPECHRPTLSTRGFGTEQIEEETRALFPEATVARLDIDTTRSARAFDRIFQSFQSGETDILIGTQMITKGLDFDNVALVGVLNADNLLNHPDFRAYERAYQMLVQVGGRTGRKKLQGEMIIQTSQPENPIIGQIMRHDYQTFFAQQMIERHTFKYPPYYRLIRITVKHQDEHICNMAVKRLASRLRLRFGNRVLGPDVPVVGKIQNKFLKNIMIKIELTASVHRAKQIIADEITAVRSVKPESTAIFVLDIDPQ